MVIEAGVQPKVLVPVHRGSATGSPRRSGDGTAARHPEPAGDGIRTARALVGPDPRAEVHVFTDGAHPDALRGQGDDVRVRWTGVGERGRNVAITSLAVRRNYFGSFDSQAFLSVANFSAEPQTFSFTLHLDDEQIAEKSLTLEPQVRRAVVLPFSHPGGGVVRARLNVPTTSTPTTPPTR